MTFSDLITEKDYAAERGVTTRTTQRERAQGYGPAYIKLGSKIFYRRKAIEDWLLAQEKHPPRANAHSK